MEPINHSSISEITRHTSVDKYAYLMPPHTRAINKICRLVRQDKIDPGGYYIDSGSDNEAAQYFVPGYQDPQTYINNLRSLFNQAIGGELNPENISNAINLGYAFEVLLCLYLSNILPAYAQYKSGEEANIHVSLVPESFDHSCQKDRHSFDIIIYSEEQNEGIKRRVPLFGISAKTTADEHPSLDPVFKIPVVTNNIADLPESIGNQDIIDFLKDPTQFLTSLTVINNEDKNRRATKILSGIIRRICNTIGFLRSKNEDSAEASHMESKMLRIKEKFGLD